MWNFACTSFVVYVELYMCSGKVQIRNGFFSRVEVMEGGGWGGVLKTMERWRI